MTEPFNETSSDASPAPSSGPTFAVRHLGRLDYDAAYHEQLRAHERVLDARDRQHDLQGIILTVEHDPVITVTRRPGAADHLLATEDALRAQGVTLRQTDRGGDITYHGPGQLVVYPIIDLKRLKLGLHDYVRALEQAVIDTIAPYGLAGHRDCGATGVWLRPVDQTNRDAKVCAIGVRVRRWITLHGLALNISPNLDHFGLIVPCGLAGRPVTSLQRRLGAHTPPFDRVAADLVLRLRSILLPSGDRTPDSATPDCSA